MVALSTGNVVITSPYDNAGGTGAGAVYLFNGATGALISTLIGSHAGDNIGSGGVTALSRRQLRGGEPRLDQRRGRRCWRGHVGQRHGRRQRRRQCHEQPGRQYGE